MLAAAAVGLWAGRIAAQTVVDGDTIKVNGTKYRIWGIDAAETKQVCPDGWMAGKEASAAMLGLITGHAVTCEAKAKDRYGRTVALCRADGGDLGAAMVSAGMAYGSTRYSSDYVEQEKAAIGTRAGGACARLRKALGLAGPE